MNWLKNIYINFKVKTFFYLSESIGFDRIEMETDDDERVISIKLTNQRLNLKRYYPDEN